MISESFMSGKKGVFICPSCQAVVKSDKPLHEGVTCGECLHEFGKSSSLSKSKTQIPGGNWEKGAGGVIRDLTAKKSAPILPQAKWGLLVVAASWSMTYVHLRTLKKWKWKG